jgi:hypothetical protein
MGDAVDREDVVDTSFVLDLLGKLSGPVALVVSLVGIIKGMTEIRKWRKEIQEIPHRIRKLDAETIKIALETSKIPNEIEKLQKETQDIAASAIANQILSNKAKISFDVIITCIDNIAKNTKDIYSSLLDSYEVFLNPAPSRSKMRAAYATILKFIAANPHSTELGRNLSLLDDLLRPINYTITDC